MFAQNILMKFEPRKNPGNFGMDPGYRGVTVIQEYARRVEHWLKSAVNYLVHLNIQ